MIALSPISKSGAFITCICATVERFCAPFQEATSENTKDKNNESVKVYPQYKFPLYFMLFEGIISLKISDYTHSSGSLCNERHAFLEVLPT